MKIFLSAIENQRDSKANGSAHAAKLLIDHGVKMKWNLMSYYYLRKNMAVAEMVRDNSEEILIDSGAHSFQKGVHVKWEEYTEQYAAFIKAFDRQNVLGYFEMDVDNVIGYDAVKSLRSRLERVTDKVIPVWHKNRGIEDFKAMCEEYSGRIVAVTGFKNEDIRDEQYMLFLNYAHSKGCKVHCLGMTRKKVLDKVPFDYSDSSSWVQDTLYGKINGQRVTREQTTVRRGECIVYSYGDKYHHAQGNYFDKLIMDERGIYRYKLEDGKPVERTQEEMDADYVEPEDTPSQLDRIEAQALYTALMTDTLIEEV